MCDVMDWVFFCTFVFHICTSLRSGKKDTFVTTFFPSIDDIYIIFN